jgi:protein involved in polysaccharide export with SLBB domain
MQPARLGARVWFVVSTTLPGLLVLAPTSGAQQAVLETPQQANDRIRELSAAAHTIPHDYVIGPGDLLTIDVFDVKELSRDVRVSQTGTIGMPLVPVRLHVAGLTEVQAQQKIAEVLEADGLVSHPEVNVSVKERKSKPITVVGAVGHALVYQAEGETTLLEVLAAAGGLANDAGDEVIVTRPGPQMTFEEGNSGQPAASADAGTVKPLQAASSATRSASSTAGNSGEPPQIPWANASESGLGGSVSPSGAPSAETITVNLDALMESGDMSHNILLEAGDVVTVPHSGIVYVMGAVSRPGGYVLTNDHEKLTTLKILALAGGFTSTAKTDRAVVIRKDGQGKQYEVRLDLRKIQSRKVEDVQLQPSDILFVPNSGAKQALLRSVEFGVALGSGVALYRLAYH